MTAHICDLKGRRHISPVLRLVLVLLPLVIVICMIVGGWLVAQSHEQATIVTQIKKAGGIVSENYRRGPLMPFSRKLVSVTLGESADSDAALRHVARLDRLDYLWLINTNISESGLPELEQLRRLNTLSFQGVPVNDASLRHIERLSDLKVFLIKDTRITPQGLAKLKQALPNLHVLVADAPTDPTADSDH